MREADYPSLTPRELAAAGRILFGVGWRGELAQALGVTEIDVVMVESGRSPAPPAWRARLVVLVQDHAMRALEAANDLLSLAEEPPLTPRAPLFA